MWTLGYPYFFRCAESVNPNTSFRNYVLAWILLAVLTVIAGIWIWLSIEIYYLLPHTFGWELLLRTFGVSFSLDCPANQTSQWPPESIICTAFSPSIPCVPIIALMMLSITLIFGVVSLLPVSFPVMDAAASGVRVTLTWHLCYTVVALIVITFFHIEDSGSLKRAMKLAINSSETDVSEVWTVTQNDGKCCGVESYKDWLAVYDVYPPSCCSDKVTTCSADSVWQQGCFKTEELKVECLGGIVFFLLSFGALLNICFCYLTEGVKALRFVKYLERHKFDEELERPLLK